MPSPSPSIQETQCSLVYVARCQVNGKRYVGITSRGLRERIRKHVDRTLRGSELVFHKALRKYGIERFEWSVLQSGLTWTEACQREKDFIAEYNTFGEGGYNVTEGGDGTLGMPLSEESRAKVSATLKAWHASSSLEAQAFRLRISALRRDTPVALTTRMKLSRSLRGRRLSEASRAKISASKLYYPEELRIVAVRIAEGYGYHAAARLLGIPRITIRRWSKTPEEMVLERSKTLERNRTRQYGYAFPVENPQM